MTKIGNTDQKGNELTAAEEIKKSAIDELIGQNIDPDRIEIGWNCKENDEGYGFVGSLLRNKEMNSKELLEHGVFQVGGGGGMPVILHVTIGTDSAYNITSIDIDAYASNGPAYGKPIYVDVTDADEKLVAKEIGRFLVFPIFADGKLVEDKKWLEQVLPHFEEMSSSTLWLKQELPKYHGIVVSLEKARDNGWIISQNGTCCSGHFELITDLDEYSFWMGLYIKTDKNHKVKSLKCILNENKPPSGNLIRSRAAHDMVEGFNFARITRFIDTITNI